MLVCLLLLVVILLQQGKGGDMAAAFGGGSSQTAFGARGGATVLSKATAVLAVLFMIGALMLAIIGRAGPGSVMGGAPAPPHLRRRLRRLGAAPAGTDTGADAGDTGSRGAWRTDDDAGGAGRNASEVVRNLGIGN